MSPEVHSLRLGLDRSYVIRDRGVIMVDAGLPWQAGAFARQIRRIPVRPEDIRLIVRTHGYFDHAGSARPIRLRTGAQVAAHAADVDLVEGRRITRPTAQTAWATAMWAFLAPLMPQMAARFGCDVAVAIGDDGLSLADYGVGGRIIHTPGHTAGSLSVLLDNGDAFVGCMAHSGPPFRLRPDLPIFADDPEELMRSWAPLVSLGAKRICPAHGRPFAVDDILKPRTSGAWGRAGAAGFPRRG